MPTTYNLIASSTVGAGGATDITFSSIPNTYTDLEILVSARSSVASTIQDISMQVGNGSVDTGTNYSYRELMGNGSAASSGSGSGGVKFNSIETAANSTANTFSSNKIYIPNYAGSTNKSMSIDAVTEGNISDTQVRLQAWLWSSTSAINIIKFTPQSGNFVQYTSIYLYGITKA